MSIDLDDFENIIERHMNRQPYKVTCYDCGRFLDYTSEVDIGLDLTMSVRPCDYCNKEKK